MKTLEVNSPCPDTRRFDRLRRTHTFRSGRLDRWRAATLAVVGAGTLGFRFATEAVLSGAKVRIYDFDVGRHENRGTQPVRHGVPKVVSAVASCDAVNPNRAIGCAFDVRHEGVGTLAEVNLLVDCSDDSMLAVPLTRLSNGLGIPLLRLALDGSGELELGRVLCSHGGAGHSCQICPYGFDDLFRHNSRTPCPGRVGDPHDPTIAGGAIAAAVGGAGLLQAQRLVTGNDESLVLDHEILIDMSHWQLLAIQRRRSDGCLSGHVRWRLTRIAKTAAETTFVDLLHQAQRRLGAGNVALEPYGHPLCVAATCDCGDRQEAVGTRWASPPRCRRCRAAMRWLDQVQYSRVSETDVAKLGIAETPLSELGLPDAGAMLVARAAGKPPLRMILE